MGSGRSLNPILSTIVHVPRIGRYTSVEPAEDVLHSTLILSLTFLQRYAENIPTVPNHSVHRLMANSTAICASGPQSNKLLVSNQNDPLVIGILVFAGRFSFNIVCSPSTPKTSLRVGVPGKDKTLPSGRCRNILFHAITSNLG